MRSVNWMLVVLASLAIPCASYAQYGAGKALPPSGNNREAAKPDAAAAPAPTHDLSGVWMMRNPPGSNRGYTNYTYTDPKTDPPSLTAWGEEKFKEAKDSNGGNYTLDQTNDPVLTKCYPPGTPRVYFHPYPFEFVQGPKFMLMVFEYDHTMRRIYTDGRALPTDPDASWMGYSVGHWDGDTLVVESAGFVDNNWIDNSGHPGTEALHLTERFHRRDFGHIDAQLTINDPKAYTKPWSVNLQFTFTDTELIEYVCDENEKDLGHLVGK